MNLSTAFVSFSEKHLVFVQYDNTLTDQGEISTRGIK